MSIRTTGSSIFDGVRLAALTRPEGPQLVVVKGVDEVEVCLMYVGVIKRDLI